MSKRTTLTTQEYLIQASLPVATDSYTVISHKAVIDKTKEVLANKGYIIKRELYRCNEGAQVAQGIYHLEHGNDPDMSMLFAWGNSYDKSMKFKCSIGAYVHVSLASIIGSNMEIFNRKHTGTADNECFETITNQINNADAYFQQLIADKEAMKLIPLTDERRAELTGRIYLINELLTSEQLAIVKTEYNKPSFDYGETGSLWSMYNSIIYSLQKAHPKTWMDQQRMVHYVLCEEFNIKTGVFVHLLPEKENNQPENINPQQMDLETMIEEVKAEEKKELTKDDILPVPEVLVHVVKNDVHGLVEEEMNMGSLSSNHLNQETIALEVEKFGPSLTEEEKAELAKPAEQLIAEHVATLPKEEPKEILVEEDHSWVCLKCGEVQGMNDPFHEGQLCTVCF